MVLGIGIQNRRRLQRKFGGPGTDIGSKSIDFGECSCDFLDYFHWRLSIASYGFGGGGVQSDDLRIEQGNSV
jgi:hypothetical protein